MSADSHTAQSGERTKPGASNPNGSSLPQVSAFKPHRGLFAVMAVVLIALMAGLIWLYVATVRPDRDKAHTIEIDTPAPAAPMPAPTPSR